MAVSAAMGLDGSSSLRLVGVVPLALLAGLCGWLSRRWFGHRAGYNVLYGDGHAAFTLVGDFRKLFGVNLEFAYGDSDSW